MDIELPRVLQSDRAVLENLYQLYLYDFSEYTDAGLDSTGHYTVDISQYWDDARWNPYFIKYAGHLAGFVVVLFEDMDTEPDPTHVVWDFFVLRKFRRKGIGSSVARQVFSMFRADWVVAELEANVPARKFWRRVISEFTHGQFVEHYREDRGKFLQSFTTK